MEEFIKVLTPNEIGELYTHWPELDNNKLAKIFTRKTKRYKLAKKVTGKHEIYEVFNVTPVVITPFREGFMVLNGKHRAYLAVKNNFNLVSYVIYDLKDLKNRIPKEVLGDLDIEEIENSFIEKENYFGICARAGKPKIKDLNPLFRLEPTKE